VPITLFRAQANGPKVPHDLGWTTTAPALSIEDAEGNHFTMMEGEAGRRLAAFVRAAIESPA
jgi:thioesterase domain-containing protein